MKYIFVALGVPAAERSVNDVVASVNVLGSGGRTSVRARFRWPNRASPIRDSEAVARLGRDLVVQSRTSGVLSLHAARERRFRDLRSELFRSSPFNNCTQFD